MLRAASTGVDTAGPDGHPVRMRPTCLGSLAATAALTLSLVPAAPAAAIDGSAALPEIPNSVAVADSGLTLASLRDSQQVAILGTDGTVSYVPVGCASVAVEISPDGDTGWVLCVGSSQMGIVDIPTRSISYTESGVTGALALEYIPSLDHLVVAGEGGDLNVIGIGPTDEYEIIHRTRAPEALYGVAVAPDGRTAYAMTAGALLYRLGVSTGTITPMPLSDPRLFLISIDMAPSGAVLYASAAEQDGDAFASVILAIEPRTGRIRQHLALTPAQESFGAAYIAVAHRSIYVASGLPVPVGDGSNGVFAVPLDAFGTMGRPKALVDALTLGAAIGLSDAGTALSIPDTGGDVVRLLVTNQPYPPEIALTTVLGAKVVSVSGRTAGVAPRTAVTVYIKVLGQRGARFVAQPRKAAVTSQGTFRWRGAAPGSRVAIYAVAGSTTSPTIRVSRP